MSTSEIPERVSRPELAQHAFADLLDPETQQAPARARDPKPLELTSPVPVRRIRILPAPGRPTTCLGARYIGQTGKRERKACASSMGDIVRPMRTEYDATGRATMHVQETLVAVTALCPGCLAIEAAERDLRRAKAQSKSSARPGRDDV